MFFSISTWLTSCSKHSNFALFTTPETKNKIANSNPFLHNDCWHFSYLSCDIIDSNMKIDSPLRAHNSPSPLFTLIMLLNSEWECAEVFESNSYCAVRHLLNQIQFITTLCRCAEAKTSIVMPPWTIYCQVWGCC